ncbi:hypothetical protein [Pantoea agglomerans]|uniref:hypothetical protein n=1 Tax=Enterobacter agglomerans TaxID=549 RepID=UPI00277FC975|nr:hypothetical protein [Pantoea agglomerans]MDQ0628052.1 hypothetical protein [Pantoea agglomerans]
MENSKLSDVKGKELVAAGHAFAKAIGMDTPLIEIAKMVTVLATRLDCALVRGDAHKQDVITWEKAMMAAIGEDGVGCVVRAIAELKAERDALAAENAARGEIIERLMGQYSAAGYHAVQNSLNPAQSLLYDAMQVLKQPATDAYLNSVRAEGADKVAEYHFVRIDALKEVSRQGHLFHKSAYSDAVNVANLFRAGKDGE